LSGLLFLIQNSLTRLSINALWTVMLILFVLTLILFLASVTTRVRHWTYDKLTETYQEKWYPIILSYIDGGISSEEVEEKFDKGGLEYAVFEKIIFEMMENLKGEEVPKLQELLYLPPIFDHHFEQLKSGSAATRIKACNYFSYIRLINYRIIEKLVSFLDSDSSMLAFSAASALTASKKVNIRARALRAITETPKYSRMAILEMIYKFHSKQQGQLEEESKRLKKLIKSKEVPPENVGILIEGAIELGYQNLLPFFFEKLQSTRYRWRNPPVLKALIKAQGDFFNVEAAELIRKFANHADPKVRKAVVEALSKLGGKEDLDVIYRLLDDDDFEVKYTAVKALDENGEAGQKLLKKSFEDPELYTRALVNTL